MLTWSGKSNVKKYAHLKWVVYLFRQSIVLGGGALPYLNMVGNFRSIDPRF